MAKKIRIISVGKAHDPLFKAGIAAYEKRLSFSMPIEWTLVPPKTEATTTASIASESNSILRTLKEAEYVILLDETGTVLSSPEFSNHLFLALETRKDVCLVIGGAYGVSEDVKKRASFVLSFGKMVFPHQLMRLILCEQLYRAVSIRSSNGYHHD